MGAVMDIFLLTRSGPIGYDEVAGFVIVATSSLKARKMAAKAHSDEGAECWLDPSKVKCEYLGRASIKSLEHVALRDYRAG